MRRTTVLALSGVFALLLSAGCSSSTPATTTAGPAATSAPKETTTTAAATVAKSKIVEDGDKICKDSDAKKSQPKSESAADVEQFLKDGAASARKDVKAIKALGTPDSDADKLTEALDKYSALIDMIEKKAEAIGKNPELISTDEDLLKAQADANKAAKAFGFKECGKDSGSSTTTTEKSGSDKSTTTKKSTDGGSNTAKAKQYVSGLSPTGTFTDEQIDCVATKVFGDADISAIALDKNTTVEQKKQLFSTLVDCIGPTFLIDAFMSGVEKKNPTAEQSACIRADLEGLSKVEGVALVSGDPDAVEAFTAKITADCKF